jgi:hypothetical protein
MRRVLVSSFFADVTQQIHSFRAKGVMLVQSSLTSASDSIAWRKSAGILCTVPEAIGCRVMMAAFYRRQPPREYCRSGGS